MSGANNSAEYTVTADPSGFTAGMERAQASARQAAQQIQSSFQAIEGQMKQLSGALKTVTGVLGTLTAIMAGGAAFKEVIGASVAWTGEAKKLSMQLGVTTERASVMMVAMRHLGIDSDVMTMAAGKMAKQIATNGQAFDKLGVSVKDSAGQYRPTLDIMGEVNSKLKEIKNPIEQNIAGTQIYGRSWNEVRGTLKMTTEEMKNAEKKTKDLGLVVGDDGAASAKIYKESLSDMKLVMTSLEVQVGAVLLPVFAKLGGWLGSAGPVAGKAMKLILESLLNIMSMVGDVVMDLSGIALDAFNAIGGVVADVMGTKAPTAMEFFVNMLKVVELAFLALKVAVKVVLDFVIGLVELWVVGIMRAASAAERALHLDFAGAKSAWESGTAKIEAIEQKHMNSLAKIAKEGKDKLDDIMAREPGKSADIKDKTIKGGPTYDFAKDGGGKDDKVKSRLHEWEAKLAADKDGYIKEQAMAGTAMEYSHAMERDYWKKILSSATLTKEEKALVEKKYYAEMALLRKDAFESDIAGEKLGLENFTNNHLARLEIANRIYEANIARYGAESKEAKAALAEVLKEQRAFAEQSIATSKVMAEGRRNAELAGIDAAEQDAQLQVALRQTTEERLLELQQGFENRRYQIKMQAMLDQEALMVGPNENPTALAQLHAQIEALEQQHQLKLSGIRNQAAVSQNKGMASTYGTIESGMARVISGTANGTLKMSALLQNMMQVVTGAVVEMLAQSAAKWLMNLIVAETTSKVSAVSQITASAGVAGAAATASAAAIPLYGWMIAPEAGLAASASAMAYLPMASARGGFDIPAGVNPITQLHEKEMVLPAAQADAVRNMADGGGAGGHTISYHDNSGRLTHTEIRKNVRVIAEALRDYGKKS